MKDEDKKILSVVLRYSIILLSSFGGLFIFYFIFTTLTIYPVYLFERLFFNPSIKDNILTINNNSFNFIKACIAGSAYFLLLALNLSTPNIKIKKRSFSLLFSSILFLLLNISRIIILISTLLLYPSLFDFTHKLFWYVLSTIFVIIIWILTIKLFKIQDIPVYSDIEYLYRKSRKS